MLEGATVDPAELVSSLTVVGWCRRRTYMCGAFATRPVYCAPHSRGALFGRAAEDAHRGGAYPDRFGQGLRGEPGDHQQDRAGAEKSDDRNPRKAGIGDGRRDFGLLPKSASAAA